MMRPFISTFFKNATVLFLGFSLLLYPSVILSQEAPLSKNFIRYQEPEFLTFEELLSLSKNPNPQGLLKEKLARFWITPIINNLAYYQGVRPHQPTHEKLGPILRVASWNIEKSLNIPEALELLTSHKELENLILKEAKSNKKLFAKLNRQRQRLLTADILVLQEMEIGVKRSGYINAAQDLAAILGMNYAYGAQQLEIDPTRLGTEKVRFEDGEVDQEASRFFAVDPKREKGVFGSAVLSRYPIKNVEVFQLKHQAYDWYKKEKEKTSFLEKARRVGSEVAFKNKLTREMKVGGRIYFRVDLEVPGIPHETLTIINIHLEIKCEPKGREEQIREILTYIKEIKNPVILIGDFNSAPTDLSPTNIPRTVKRNLKKPSNWFSLALNYVTPDALVINTTRTVSNVTKNLDNPLASDIPIIAPNPTKGLFEKIRNFRFIDDITFDFRGDKERSMHENQGILSNSNQHDLKGFRTTFEVNRPLWVVGKFRLDWIFVKSFLNDPEEKQGPYQFAPHFGETLTELNMNLKKQISDHHPNVVDLPFQEPKIN